MIPMMTLPRPKRATSRREESASDAYPAHWTPRSTAAAKTTKVVRNKSDAYPAHWKR